MDSIRKYSKVCLRSMQVSKSSKAPLQEFPKSCTHTYVYRLRWAVESIFISDTANTYVDTIEPGNRGGGGALVAS